MSYNGSGTFLINTAGQPVVTGTVISSTTFNTLTADLGTGLSTAITKDGQTTTTSRIPFIAGISSTLTTDSTSVGTGSIITSGGVGIAKGLYVGLTANIAGAVTLGGAVAITSSSANALAVGLNGATNPAFNVDASTASSATGLNVKSAAAAGGVALSVTSSGSNEALTLNAKGTGTIGIGSVSTGAVTITPATTVTGLITSTGGITGGASSHTTGTYSSTLGVTGAASLSSTLAVTGIASFAAGSAAAPAITRTGDLDTGVWFPAANALGLSSGGTNAVYIDSSQFVGIGASTTAQLRSQLTVSGGGQAGANLTDYGLTDGTIQINSNVQAYNRGGALTLGCLLDNASYTPLAAIKSLLINGGGNGIGDLAFSVRNAMANTNLTEAMRIDNSGNLLVGVTSAYLSTNTFFKTSGASQPCLYLLKNSTANTDQAFCIANGVAGGTISFQVLANGNAQNTNNSYGAISDVKLKENIVDASPKLADLMQIKVRHYNFKSDETKTKQIGVVAQELEQVFPAMIEETVDCDLQGNDLGTTTKSVKYSVFVPMLIKAMQEQQALIQSLTTRLTALEAK